MIYIKQPKLPDAISNVIDGIVNSVRQSLMIHLVDDIRFVPDDTPIDMRNHTGPLHISDYVRYADSPTFYYALIKSLADSALPFTSGMIMTIQTKFILSLLSQYDPRCISMYGSSVKTVADFDIDYIAADMKEVYHRTECGSYAPYMCLWKYLRTLIREYPDISDYEIMYVCDRIFDKYTHLADVLTVEQKFVSELGLDGETLHVYRRISR